MSNCIVVVQFPVPKRSHEQAIASGTSTAPTYRGLGEKGLIRKDYLNGDAGTGGVYLWESRAALFSRSLRVGVSAPGLSDGSEALASIAPREPFHEASLLWGW